MHLYLKNDSQPLDLSTKNTPTVPKCHIPLNDVEDEIPVLEDGNGVDEDEIPVVEDGNAVNEDEIPVVEDGNAVNKDEIPVVEDENIVVIDGVHEDEDNDFKTPYCPRNLRTLEHQHKNSEDGEIPKIGRGNYFPTHLFENEHAEVVEHIPKYIDGFKKYLIETNNYVKDTHDLRYFVMLTSSKADYKDVRKVGTCQESWECQNSYGRFMDTPVDKQSNRIDWITVKGKKDLKICSVCKCIAKRQGCGACKLIDYNPKTKIAVVFHIGKHKCWKRFDNSHIIAAHHEKKKNKPRSGPAKDMAIDDIIEY